MITEKTLQLLQDNEGYRQFLYECTAGKKTIGIGFNLDDVGLSLDESQVILNMRLQKISDQLTDKISCYANLNDARKSALCDMAYQLGVSGLMSFKKSIAKLEAGEYQAAANEFLDSKWAIKDTPVRAAKITNMIYSGEW